jgi:hypothetical protein
MQAAMPKRKRHSRVEIATKLAKAHKLATQGKPQSECHDLAPVALRRLGLSANIELLKDQQMRGAITA